MPPKKQTPPAAVFNAGTITVPSQTAPTTPAPAPVSVFAGLQVVQDATAFNMTRKAAEISPEAKQIGDYLVKVGVAVLTVTGKDAKAVRRIIREVRNAVAAAGHKGVVRGQNGTVNDGEALRLTYKVDETPAAS